MTKRVLERMKKKEEEAEDIIFSRSVDKEQCAVCQCGRCPPRHEQSARDYCCAALFAFPLKSVGASLKEGVHKKMGENEGCITTSHFFKERLLKDEVGDAYLLLFLEGN